MKRLLKDIVRISSGIYEKSAAYGEVYYIQARHFDSNRMWRSPIHPELPANARLEKHHLSKGDVLLAAKGNSFYAVVFDGAFHPAVASSLFMILRPEPEVLPEFLSVYLNHPRTQQLLSGAAKGTSLPSINSQDVGLLELDLPPIEKQETIVKLSLLQKREIQLQNEIQHLRSGLIHAELENIFFGKP